MQQVYNRAMKMEEEKSSERKTVSTCHPLIRRKGVHFGKNENVGNEPIS